MPKNNRGSNAICPYCKSKMKVTRVARVTELLTRRTYTCSNENYICGAVIEYAETPMLVLSPPSRLKQGIDIPMSPKIKYLSGDTCPTQ